MKRIALLLIGLLVVSCYKGTPPCDPSTVDWPRCDPTQPPVFGSSLLYPQRYVAPDGEFPASLVPSSVIAFWYRADKGGTLNASSQLTALADGGPSGIKLASFGTGVDYIPGGLLANGRGAWRNALGQGFQSTTTNGFTPGAARTFFCVIRPSSDLGGPVFENTKTGVRFTLLVNGASNPQANLAFTDSADGAKSAYFATPLTIANQLLVVKFKVSALPAFVSCKINGVTQTLTQSTACPVETGTAGMRLGSWLAGGGSVDFVGDYYEAIGLNGTATAAQENAVETYLGTRYGVRVFP